MHYGYCAAHSSTDPHYCGAPCCARKPAEPQACAACGGPLNAETTRQLVSADIPMSKDECPFVPQGGGDNPFLDFTCANDGWLKIEHEEFSEDQTVHGSCYLDHDDVLSLVY